MGIQRRNCVNHPDRQAIGVCVITQQAICAECSTRYEGVNYSKEGLRLLQERRRQKDSSSTRSLLISGTLLLASPLMLLLLYLSYSLLVSLVTNIVRWS